MDPARRAGLRELALLFLRLGTTAFGGPAAHVAMMEDEVVRRRRVTPGPVFTTATFVGFLLGGASGAAVATLGIFLPAFVFVALSGPLVPRLRRSAAAGAFLDGVNLASLALMAVVTAQLARAAIVDPPTALLAAASAALLALRVNSSWLVVGGAAAGLLLGA